MLRWQGHIRSLLASAGAAATAAAFIAAPACAQTGIDRTVEHDGRTRAYRIYSPSNLDSEQLAPLVFALHGGGGNGPREEGRVRYNEFAERDGWIVVYPDAVNGHWNDLRGFEGFVSQREHVDDIGFIELLLNQVSTEFPIDPN